MALIPINLLSHQNVFLFKTLYSFILPQISNLSNHFYVIYEIGLDNAVVIRFHKYTLLSSI
ncbi:protein of unknown function [Latilactobacillus sakei]|nr:hypothetical protein LSAJ160_90012 [Latilactobacillus sakei]SON64688.1 protein of unknown function [Latilactobacillus sakei]SON72699.1 protein of unknown function [Latilactobacillus sakei]